MRNNFKECFSNKKRFALEVDIQHRAITAPAVAPVIAFDWGPINLAIAKAAMNANPKAKSKISHNECPFMKSASVNPGKSVDKETWIYGSRFHNECPFMKSASVNPCSFIQ